MDSFDFVVVVCSCSLLFLLLLLLLLLLSVFTSAEMCGADIDELISDFGCLLVASTKLDPLLVALVAAFVPVARLLSVSVSSLVVDVDLAFG